MTSFERKTWLIALLFLLGARGRAVSAATISAQDKPAIPPDLLFEFTAVPDDENAIIDWRKAAAVRVSPPDELVKMMPFAWTPGQREPSPDDMDKLREWVRRNRAALDLMEASLAKPKAQWPERDPQKPDPELSGLATLIRARLVEADELAEHHEYARASQSLLGSLHLDQRGMEADDYLIHYLLAGNSRVLVLGGIIRFGTHAEAPLPLLEQLLKELPLLDSETNTYAKVLRTEFSGASVTDVQKLANGLSSETGALAATLLFPDEYQRPFRVLLDPSLTAQHPRPLDLAAESERTARWYRIYQSNSMSAWSNRNDSVADERQKIAEKLLEEIKPLMKAVEGEPLPLSRQAARKALPLYLKIQDPVGRIFCCEVESLSVSDERVFRYRTEREVARALLAILIFERQKNHLPATLSELVDEKILYSVPQDPFAGKPLSYSRERRIVWSVGRDGVDDNGDGDPAHHWAGDDAVWQIPEIK